METQLPEPKMLRFFRMDDSSPQSVSLPFSGKQEPSRPAVSGLLQAEIYPNAKQVNSSIHEDLPGFRDAVSLEFLKPTGPLAR